MVLDSKTESCLSYTIIEQDQNLFRVEDLSTTCNDHTLIDFRNTSLFWIFRQEAQPHSKPHWHENQEARDRFERILMRCEDDPEQQIKIFDGSKLKAVDYLRLRPKK